LKPRLLVLSLLALALALPLVAFTDVGVGSGGGTPGTSLNFQAVASNPLYGRGMNAALALYDHYVYMGNRTDGSDTCGIGDPRRSVEPCPHPHPGVLIADIADPAHPTIVGEIGGSSAFSEPRALGGGFGGGFGGGCGSEFSSDTFGHLMGTEGGG
jgi:hypothetical protein